MHPNLIVVDHPLVKHKLTLMRRKETSTAQFRALLSEIALLLGYEAMRNLKLTDDMIETPLMPMKAQKLEGKKLVLITIMRAGQGLVDGMLQLVPSARVGHVGLIGIRRLSRRSSITTRSPSSSKIATCSCAIPMLATGNSAIAALDRLKKSHPGSLRLVCLLACPKGSPTWRRLIPTFPLSPRQWTKGSTIMVTSCPVWATRETGSSGPSRGGPWAARRGQPSSPARPLYFNRLSVSAQRIYLASDAIREVALPNPEMIQPLLPLLRRRWPRTTTARCRRRPTPWF